MKPLLLILLLLTSCTEKQRLNFLICRTANQYNIPCSTAKELAHIESSHNPNAERFERREYYRLLRTHPRLAPEITTSYGLFQVMGYHVKDPLTLLNPKTNIETAMQILKSNLNRCKTLKNALNAYNTGSCTKLNVSYLSKFKTLG